MGKRGGSEEERDAGGRARKGGGQGGWEREKGDRVRGREQARKEGGERGRGEGSNPVHGEVYSIHHI